jgi:chromosomal replication initiation ATPase DnaA
VKVPSQLPLPLAPRQGLSRADLIVAPANAQAVAFIETWPSWPVAAAAIHGPAGSGKSHLVAIWRQMSNALVVAAADLPALSALDFPGHPLAVENVDLAAPGESRDRTLFAALERATLAAPLLLTGKEHPAAWACSLPDLASRFSALVSFPVWTPDEGLLTALARKLFDDRQLAVPDAVIAHMLRSLERSPSAIRDFVALADSRALAQARPVNVALVKELLAERG